MESVEARLKAAERQYGELLGRMMSLKAKVDVQGSLIDLLHAKVDELEGKVKMLTKPTPEKPPKPEGRFIKEGDLKKGERLVEVTGKEEVEDGKGKLEG